MFDVDSAEVVMFQNVTFEYNSGTGHRLHANPNIELRNVRSVPEGTNDVLQSIGTGIRTTGEDCNRRTSNPVQVSALQLFK